MVLFGLSGCVRAKVVVFGQKWLYSGKRGCIRETVAIFGFSGCIRAKVVVLSQRSIIRAKVVVFGNNWLYSGKVIVFGKKRV